MTDEKEIPPAGTGTRTAMQTLKNTRPLEIQWGCFYAVKIALKKRTVHSRDVWDAMLADGIIKGYGKAFWLGTVFKTLKTEGVLTKTLHSYTYSDEARGIHERTIPLWELNEKADLTAYRTAPTEKLGAGHAE